MWFRGPLTLLSTKNAHFRKINHISPFWMAPISIFPNKPKEKDIHSDAIMSVVLHSDDGQ
jgi:hypothetical protein